MAGLTQEETAEYVGVSRTAVVRWERGDIEPRLQHLYMLSQLFSVTSDYLLGLNGLNSEERNSHDITISPRAMSALNSFIYELKRSNDPNHQITEE